MYTARFPAIITLIAVLFALLFAVATPVSANDAEKAEDTELEPIVLDYSGERSSEKKDKDSIEKKLEIFHTSSAKLKRDYRIFFLPMEMKAKVLWKAPEYSLSSSNMLSITENFVLTAAYDYEKTVFDSNATKEYSFEIDYRLRMSYSSLFTAGIGYSSGRAVDILDEPRFIVVYEKVF
jgi:hypothetical protein